MRAQGSGSDGGAESESCTFDGEGVQLLLDLRWHKVALSVHKDAASLHVDCSSIENKPLGPRGQIPTQGHTLLAIQATDGAAAEVRGAVQGSWEFYLHKTVLRAEGKTY